ncbi:MAG: hypothetical protein RBS80_23760 [Thermoguttaceae bacterium]|jgi:hypothetical protein|nr:hypothetical protein [Thermoguttaceae bacterium]
MIIVAVRETVVLLLGCLFVFIGALILGNANREFAALASAIILPIVFCLIRASLIKRPDSALSAFRSVGYQLCLGIAFVFLLIFEMSLGLFVGAADIPATVWLIVGGFGMGYVSFFSVAFRVGSTCDGSDNGPFDIDVNSAPTGLSTRRADEQDDARERPASVVVNWRSITAGP